MVPNNITFIKCLTKSSGYVLKRVYETDRQDKDLGERVFFFFPQNLFRKLLLKITLETRESRFEVFIV